MALKLIHTADWHLGQTFFGYDRDYEHDRFLGWLAEYLGENEVDALLITGDIFDVANPSAAAQRRFFHFLRETHRLNPDLQIIVTAGNHDSAARLEAPVPLLEEMNTHITGVIRRNPEGDIDFESLIIPLKNKKGEEAAYCLTVPYLRQGDYPHPEELPDSYIAGIGRMYQHLCAYVKINYTVKPLIAMGHLHATGAELSGNDRSERIIMGGLESVSCDAFPEELSYVALGHIHKAQRIGGREHIRYAGSPIPMSFSEQHYKHQVVSITLTDTGETIVNSVPVPVTTGLMKVPGQPLPPQEVLAALSELPDKGELPEWEYPFVEVQVLMTAPDPGFRHKVEETLTGKAARLTSIVPSYPKRENEEQYIPLSFDSLQKIDPMDMLRHAFSSKYGDNLPEEIEELFKEVVREVEL